MSEKKNTPESGDPLLAKMRRFLVNFNIGTGVEAKYVMQIFQISPFFAIYPTAWTESRFCGQLQRHVAVGSVISRLLCVKATSTRGGLLLRWSSCSSSLLWPSDEGRSIRGGGGTVVYSTCTSPLLSLSWLLDR